MQLTGYDRRLITEAARTPLIGTVALPGPCQCWGSLGPLGRSREPAWTPTGVYDELMGALPEEDFTPDELAAFAECDAWIRAGLPSAMSHEEFMAELGMAQ